MRSATTLVGILVASILAMGCVTQDKYDKLKTQADKLGKDLSKERLLTADLKKKLQDLEDQLSSVKSSMGKLTGKTAAMKARMARMKKALRRLAELEAKIAAQKRMNDRLRRSFQKMISAGKLRIVRVGSRLVIQMASKILFKPGKADLTNVGDKAIADIGKVLKKIPRHFQVAGHTDNVPIKRSKHKDNWQLSAVRAVMVVRILKKAGVPGRNISAAGYGPWQPTHSNRSWKGRQNNRRIEITLLPKLPARGG